MFVLAVDTSSAAVTAGLVEMSGEPRLLASRVTVDARAHGELLTPSIQQCLAEAGLAASQLDAVVAGLGPGPFTGLRVGLVTAAALADALEIPAYGVCSLDGIAGAAGPGTLLVAADARRHEVYWASYTDGVRTAGPDVSRPGELTVRAEAMAGAGARRYADVLGARLLDVDFPSALALVALAADRLRSGAPGETLTPLYLRRPDAVPPGPGKPVTR